MIKIVILSSVAVMAVFAGYDVPVMASAPAQSGYGAAQGYDQAAYAPRYVQALPTLPSRHSYLYPPRRHSHSSSSSSEEHRRRRCDPPFDLCKTSTSGCVHFNLPGYNKKDKTVNIVCGENTSSMVSGKNTPIVTSNGSGDVEVIATCGKNGKWSANGVKFTEIKCIEATTQ